MQSQRLRGGQKDQPARLRGGDRKYFGGGTLKVDSGTLAGGDALKLFDENEYGSIAIELHTVSSVEDGEVYCGTLWRIPIEVAPTTRDFYISRMKDVNTSNKRMSVGNRLSDATQNFQTTYANGAVYLHLIDSSVNVSWKASYAKFTA